MSSSAAKVLKQQRKTPQSAAAEPARPNTDEVITIDRWQDLRRRMQETAERADDLSFPSVLRMTGSGRKDS
jgi:hypothetical protein